MEGAQEIEDNRTLHVWVGAVGEELGDGQARDRAMSHIQAKQVWGVMVGAG